MTTEGPFGIEISANGISESRTVIVDRSGPTIAIVQPKRGTFIDIESGPMFTVAGRVEDPSGIDSVSVNGNSTELDTNGEFSLQIRGEQGVNLVRIEATDKNGDTNTDIRAVIIDAITPFETSVDDAITIRLDRDALDLAADGFGQTITPDVFGDLGGSIQQGNFQVRGITISDTEVKLHPGPDILGIELRLYGLKLDFAATFEGVDVKGNIDANPAVIRLDLRINTDGLGGLDLRVVNADAEMDNFDFDVDGPLGLFDWAIRGIVRKQLETGLADALRGKVLADLLGADALNQTGELLGFPAEYALALTHLSVDPNGIELALDAGIQVSTGPRANITGLYFQSHTATARTNR